MRGSARALTALCCSRGVAALTAWTTRRPLHAPQKGPGGTRGFGVVGANALPRQGRHRHALRRARPLVRAQTTTTTTTRTEEQVSKGKTVRNIDGGIKAQSGFFPLEDASSSLPTRYEFGSFEAQLYAWWEDSGFFEPRDAADDDDAPPYTLPMPPPNVTGRLHLGHAMFVALQDVLARFHRMRGRPTLWLPGTDHAGIATQMLVERALARETPARTRQDLGRDAFLERVWRWKAENGGAITGQMRRLGASADWSRERFTLEPALSTAVVEAFVRLHEKGLVYRGSRMVNWSPTLQTAVSDLEVEVVERTGKLYYFKYPLYNEDATIQEEEYLPVATTRPETVLGDSAVCVNPSDERYKKYIGRECVVPALGATTSTGTTERRRVPVIADDYVDKDFGTGVLKITPGHDPNDYQVGLKHDLPIYSIFNPDATVVDGYGEYSGLDRFEARKKLWADWEAHDLALHIEEKVQRVPISQRGGEVIEPLVSTQWFVNTSTMASAAKRAVVDGKIKFVPARFEKEWFYWLDNIQDWCVSRQIWWGHRIPAWHVEDGASDVSPNTSSSGGGGASKAEEEQDQPAQRPTWFVARSEAEARAKARETGISDDVKLRRDDDVLDTWFSSGLWPFATVGWPDVSESIDFKRFYPANCLETGYDILFFWVARMVMLGLELTGEVPFDTVYMHGLVRDAQNRKMSKTVGNVVDPLDLVDAYGADALRYTLVTGVTPGQDLPLSTDRVEANRNFANKVWNVGRFVDFKLQYTGDDSLFDDIPRLDDLTDKEDSTDAIGADEFAAMPLPERWIISRARRVSAATAAALEDYAIGEAGRLVYEFIWDELADWYVEIAKTRSLAAAAASSSSSSPGGDEKTDDAEELKKGVASARALAYAVDVALRLLHPFMPHVTEYLWQRVVRRRLASCAKSTTTPPEALMIAAWPARRGKAPPIVDETALIDFDAWRELVRALRNIRAEYDTPAKTRMSVVVACDSPRLAAALRDEAAALALLAKVDAERLVVVVQNDGAAASDTSLPAAETHARLVVLDGLEAFVPFDDLKTIKDAAKEIDRLDKQLSKLEKEIAGLDARLSKPGFVDKAPKHVVDEARNALAERNDQRQTILDTIADLQKEQASQQQSRSVIAEEQ